MLESDTRRVFASLIAQLGHFKVLREKRLDCGNILYPFVAGIAAARSVAQLVWRHFRSNIGWHRQDEGFAAANSNWKLNGFTFSRVSSPPTCIDRTKIPVAPQSRGSLGVHPQQAHDERCRSARPRAGSATRSALPPLAGRGDAYRPPAAGRAGSAPSGARQFPGDCALAGRNAGDGLEHVAGQAARRLHSAARAQSSQSDARGWIAASERDPGHGWAPASRRRSIGWRSQGARSISR